MECLGTLICILTTVLYPRGGGGEMGIPCILFFVGGSLLRRCLRWYSGIPLHSLGENVLHSSRKSSQRLESWMCRWLSISISRKAFLLTHIHHWIKRDAIGLDRAWTSAVGKCERKWGRMGLGALSFSNFTVVRILNVLLRRNDLYSIFIHVE